MSDAEFIREVEELYQRIAEADTDNFVELAKIAGLDIKTDLVGADLSKAALSDQNMNNELQHNESPAILNTVTDCEF